MDTNSASCFTTSTVDTLQEGNTGRRDKKLHPKRPVHTLSGDSFNSAFLFPISAWLGFVEDMLRIFCMGSFLFGSMVKPKDSDLTSTVRFSSSPYS